MCYDANGNPVDVSDMHFHWTNGRMLDSITYTDDQGVEQPFMSFTYDDNGIRTSKTYGDTTTYYTNVDGAITSQYCLDGDGAVTDLMQFIYDGSNDLLGFTYNGATYFYVKNLQGDVIAVIDSAGAEKAVYEYGAYGRLIYSDGDLADVNPMRYRGYYYDSDAGMYYLQSRYYAPEFAKFLNSDLPEYAQQQKNYNYGTNLFAYCGNDPVNNVDYDGRCWWAGPGKIGHDSWEGPSTYKASDALSYAEKWYNSRNYMYYDYNTNGDCANFVSQCLYAGGIKMTSTWYSFRKNKDPKKGKKWNKKHGYYYLVSDNWSLAKNLYNYFVNSQFCKEKIIIRNRNDISKVASSKSVKIGDIMFFDWGNGKGISHATIISKVDSSDIYYAAHSKNRYIHSVKGAYSSKWKIYIISMKKS